MVRRFLFNVYGKSNLKKKKKKTPAYYYDKREIFVSGF